MGIKKYDEISEQEIDVIREVASIGTGYAATSLAGLLGQQTKMTIPEINILEHNEVVKKIGEPEEGVAAVLVQMSGDMEGLMLFMLKMDFINIVLEKLMGKTISSYDELTELEMSALTESGNILISSYVNALSKLLDMDISLSVPMVTVDMLGGILTVPMTQFGYETDKLMIIDGQLVIDGRNIKNMLLMMPNIESFNKLMNKLVGGEA